MTEKVFDPSKPVQTRDGRPARIICTDRGGVYPIVALVKTPNSGIEIVGAYKMNGSGTHCASSRLDLINVPERKSKFVNVYNYDLTVGYESQEAADKSRKSGCGHKGQVEIIFEDGKPVETKLHLKE
jgi:hypothetical protein